MNVTKFNKGEIWWYINPNKDKEQYCQFDEDQDFISNRPVVVVSTYVDHYRSSVTIVPLTTSKNRFGIMIDYDNNTEVSKILPQQIRTVPTEYLKKYVGKLSDDKIKELDNSILYHLGLSDKQPMYVKIEKEFVKNQNNKFNYKQKKFDSKNRYHYEKNNSYKTKNIFKENNDNFQDTQNHEHEYVSDNKKFEIKSPIDKKWFDKAKNIKPASDKYMQRTIRKEVHCTKNIGELYNRKFNSIEDKVKAILLNDTELSSKKGIPLTNINQIKDLCCLDIAIRTLKMFDQIKGHKKLLSKLSNNEKYLLLMMDGDMLVSLLRKRDIIIKYRNSFINELGIKKLIEGDEEYEFN